MWTLTLAVLENSVLLLLLGLSIWSVAVMLDRVKALRQAESENETQEAKNLIRKKDWSGLESWSKSRKNLVAGTLSVALETDSKEADKVERSVKSFLTEEKIRLEKGFTLLATLGSNAPFIGLFGTVLGIIKAFAALSNDQAGAQAVMEGISLALIATAAGLFVAIPAVVAYNIFSRRLRLLLTECEAIRDLYLSRLGTEK